MILDPGLANSLQLLSSSNLSLSDNDTASPFEPITTYPAKREMFTLLSFFLLLLKYEGQTWNLAVKQCKLPFFLICKSMQSFPTFLIKSFLSIHLISFLSELRIQFQSNCQMLKVGRSFLEITRHPSYMEEERFSSCGEEKLSFSS